MDEKGIQKILEERYLREGEKGWDDLCKRVAKHFAYNSKQEQEFFSVMKNREFLPNSPALMNAGTDIKSYSACFVLPIEDDMKSIFKYYSDAALISKSGGGVGANFSKLRPEGSRVNSTDGVASGPVSFMKIQDAATDVIKQGGRRRGANMAVLDCYHPDIKKFITVKAKSGVLENFNLSVRVTDQFMQNAVDDVSSEEHQVLQLIAENACYHGEPGILFGDRIEQDNYRPDLGELSGVNPCGEQPLLPYENCCLGSINLEKMYDPEFNSIDWDKLEYTVIVAVELLNNILDLSEFPVPECNKAMRETRKIGLGIMGLHDLLILMHIPYDSRSALGVANAVMEFIHTKAKYYSNGRNTNVTSIAPTGTLSMLAGCSYGCEPYYAPYAIKTVMDGHQVKMYNKHISRIAKETGLTEEEVLEKHKDLFKAANEISWRSHVDMQAALQEHVDSGVSKTINMPKGTRPKEVLEAYVRAWKKGCKGLTVYVDGSRGEQVFTTEDACTEEPTSTQEELPVPYKLVLPDTLDAKRYRVKDRKKRNVYFTVCTVDDQPVEVFAKLPVEEADSFWHTICRLLSLCMRYNIPLEEITKQLWRSASSVADEPAKLARILDQYHTNLEEVITKKCPKCHDNMTPQSGCWACESCGYSECG